MNKKKRYIFITVAVLLVMLIVSPFLYVQANKFIYAHRVTEYLIEKKGYAKDEIASVQGVWSVKLPPFLVIVKFKDEPDVEYIYFAHAGVLQSSHRISDEAIQRGKTKSDLKHFAPTMDMEQQK